ncbi:MAG: bacillithiol biosynthesis cysteine-adding enzyme BshC [Acidobacteriia bacterium]|nr:bacillithiol biosynthesis cysteine-adding enzyme BshC [Terriglobia bacterium]
MSSECLPCSAIPHTTALFADYLNHFERTRSFYPRPPFDRSWISEEAGRIRYDQQRRERVAAILDRQNRAWGASQETLDNIARLRSGASVIVTGQQVTLFGGPLFSLYKALTAVKLATEFSQGGVDCVPVFWLATEDHDLEEVNHVTLFAADNSLKRFFTSARGTENAPVGSIRFGADMESLAAEAAQALGDSEAADFLRQSYRAGETFGSAFGTLFSRLFKHSGVVLLDASDPELRQVAASVYRAAAVGAADLDEALFRRNQLLESAGYHVQVHVTSESTLLFAQQDGGRFPVHRANGKFEIVGEKLSESELVARIAAAPQEFSANVLLRPVVQDYLLPTLAYVGGPAEVAYFAQAAVVYEELLGRVTPILPRFAATLVEARIKRLLDRYQIKVTDTFHGDEHLRVLLAEHTLPEDLNATFGQVSKSVDDSLLQLNAVLERVDKTLLDAAATAASKMRYQIERLRERAARAQLRRGEDQARHASELSAALHPNKNLQEREVAGISYLARHSTQLLLRLYDAAQTSCPDHQIVYL